ncbi:TonB-dependent receptor [Pedobacter rhodius]|uniref:TonB-dependent receptor n=1 Tax=Pedobacter rhodius TaxID=3004098 RepID=A0ABT4L271_9SPHI|nr:TonB-dependent receptor [Pedobacter sp. SJ11]MCZ4225293.1 TonB-dependent receptor [Pedobacter sp. SJ11]
MYKIRLFLFTILLSLSGINSFAQQSSTLKGKIITSDGAPAAFISIGLKGKGLGTTTDENGNYTIPKVKPGTYIIRVSAVGLKSEEKTINITAGETSIVDFSLVENADQLKEVNISSSKRNKFATKKSEYVAKLPLKNLENPQVYTTISRELMEEQMVTNFSDALKNTPGLDKLWTSTGRGGDGASYYNLRGFTTQVSVIDGIAGLTNGDLDPSNIETIEVIKGPSGTLYGGAITNFGGLVNIVTKKPLDTMGGSINYNTGSFGLNRLTADVYAPVNKDKNLLFRVNAAYNKQNSWQDAGFSNSTFIAPALEYRINEKLKLNLGAEFYNYEGTNPLMVFLNRSRQLIARTPDELNFDFGRSFTSNDLTIKTPTRNVHGQLTYKISDNWISQTNFSQSIRKSEGYYQYVMYLGATDDLLSRYINIQNSASTSADVQQNFIGDFKIAGLRNRMIIGLDYLNQKTDNSNSPYILFDNINSVNVPASYANISKAAVDAKIGAAASGYAKNSTISKVYSAYASDVLNVTDALSAMFSLRVDRFDNKGTYDQATNRTTGDYKQTAISPKFGLVYEVIKDQVSIFGNYMNGFRNVATVTQPLSDISGVFKPQQANQIEGGIKADLFHNKLNLTASYYNIDVKNMTRSESIVRNGTTYNITVQDGTQLSKGIEISLNANPVDGLNFVAGYSHNDSKMVKAAPSVEGRRPVSAGPEDMVNAWLSYTLTKGKLQGLGLGFGGNYNSENIITNSLATGVFTLPSYTVLNATAFYSKNRYRLGLKVDNLADVKYYKGWTTVEQQMPRSLVANISFKF